MEYNKRENRLICLGILLVSAVLLLSVIPIADTAEGASRPFYGWVFDQDSGKPIENVKVTLFHPDKGTTTWDKTDEDGFFEIQADTGHHLIHFSHPGYISTTLTVMMNKDDRNLDEIHLTKITMIDDATLSGIINDTNGKPAKKAYVYLIDKNPINDGPDLFNITDSHVMMTKTDNSGNYNFKDAYTGTFTLMARVASSKYYYGNEKDITLESGDNTENITYTDYYEGHKVYVRVEDSKGGMINGADIIVYDPAHNMWNTSTDSPGRVYVTDGDYDLIVRKAGYGTHIEHFTVNAYTPKKVILEPAEDSTNVMNVTFVNWENAIVNTTQTRQFDDSPNYMNHEWRIFRSGIIRHDVDRIFGDGDGTLILAEKTAYVKFLNDIGPDGDFTGNKFKVNSKEYKYNDYSVNVDMGDSQVVSSSPLQFDYDYNLTAANINAYKVDMEVDHAYVTVDLPDNPPEPTPDVYEIINEGSLVSHDENDTTVVFINATYEDTTIVTFTCAMNVLPTPVIKLTADFNDTDDIHLYKEGIYIEFNASQSNDANLGKILSYDWNFSTFEGVPVGTNNTAVAIRNFTEGTYNVTLRVKDNAGEYNETNITLIVDGTSPEVNFSVEPDIVNQGLETQHNTTLYLNITELLDDNGIYADFCWNLGDGNFSNMTTWSDRNITYNYQDLNISMLTGENEYTYTINLTVRDNAGNEKMVSHTVKVNNTRRPVATFTISHDMVKYDDNHIFNADENITFNATESHGQERIVNYTWDFDDDGTPDSYGEVVNHSYASKGTYNATLTVKDRVGGTSTVNKTIYIDTEPPTVLFEIEGAWYEDGWYYIDQMNNTNTIEDYLINLTANGTHDNGPVGELKGLYNFTWNFEEPDSPGYKGTIDENLSIIATDYSFNYINNTANNITIENITHYYYTVTLTVFDRAGNNASFSRNIIVNDTEAPEAKFDYKDEIDEGGYMELNATTSTDNIGIADYSWIITDPDGDYVNTTDHEGESVINITFSKDGLYTVILNATDTSGNIDSHDSVVKVNRLPKPDIFVNSDDIFYSKDKIIKGNTIEIMVNITNLGDLEAFNITVKFYFRKTIHDEMEYIDEYEFMDPLIPGETRLANITFEAKESGQIVVNATIPSTDPTGKPQVDSDLANNEGIRDIYIKKDDEASNKALWYAVTFVIIIIVVALLIFIYKPELMGIKPVKTVKKKGSKKKKKKK